MYIKATFNFWETFNWSKNPFFVGVTYALSIISVHQFLNINFALPWHPISVVGIALALFLGFKNNSSHARIVKSEKAYGDISNDSSAFIISAISFIQGDDAKKIKKELTYRHIAWITALRFQLRTRRPWEHAADNKKFNKLDFININEKDADKLFQELKSLLPADEIELIKTKTNIATQILHKQSQRLQELRNEGYFNNFQHVELHKLLISANSHQGDVEILKDFPVPRQYSITVQILTIIFCTLAPLGIYEAFEESISLNMLDTKMIWAFPVISGFVTWVFCFMAKVDLFSENPFEETINSVPITALSRKIEIDLREMLNEDNIPKPITHNNGVLM